MGKAFQALTIIFFAVGISLSFAIDAVVYKLDGQIVKGRWLGADGGSLRLRLQTGEVIKMALEQVEAVEFIGGKGRARYEALKHLQNGREFLELGMIEEAKKQFMEAIRAAPKFPDPYYELAKLLEEEGKIEEAFKYYGLVASLAPGKFNMADKFKAMAERYEVEGHLDKSAEAYYRLFLYFPSSPYAEEAIYKAGMIYAEQLGKPDKAIEVLRKAVQSFPDNPLAEKSEFLIGKLLIKLARYEEAISALTDFINSHPQSEWLDDAHFARGVAYHELRRHEKALEEFNLVKSTSPDPLLVSEASRMIDESAWEIYTISDGLPSNEVQALALDGNFLWVGTSKGLVKLDLSSGTPTLSPDVPSIGQLNVKAIAVSEREVWIGTLNSGVLRIDKETGAVKSYTQLEGLPSRHITDVEILGDEVWVASFGGVAFLDRETDTWVKFTTREGLPGNDAVDISLTPNTVWVATSMNGLAMFDKETRTWRSLRREDGLPSDSIRSIIATDDVVWLGWYKGNTNGYTKYDLLQDKLLSTMLMEDETTPVEDILIALSDGEFWVATDAGAFVELAGVGWDSVDYPSKFEGARVNCIVVSNSIVWFGTSKGLGKLDYRMLIKFRGLGG